ncbi:hypothetical protein Lalb_Chr08g0235831 [Lupinus albus]|uniref:Uncharacterized protein n=1 Tax=Lupinus albus TaxID=3870 RepID=A0A6A4Q4U2_LUPAL|nr:hypothetical protein Lalb_Chr08g0235831 [Lupinus albus]
MRSFFEFTMLGFNCASAIMYYEVIMDAGFEQFVLLDDSEED